LNAEPPAPARNWPAETQRLARDAVLAPFIERGHAFVLFDAAGRMPLHANAAGGEVLAAGFAPVSANRLVALAEGLAPASGLRLERLQVGDPADPVTLTMVCRRVSLSDGAPALLVAALTPVPALTRARSTQLTSPVNVRQPASLAATPVSTPAQTSSNTSAVLAMTPAPPRDRVRLIWETTADGDLRLISPECADVIGDDGVDAMDRRPLPELIGERIADVSGGLASMLGQNRTWSGVETLWRIGEGAEGVRVVMSGLPVGPAGALRGFAVAHLLERAPFPLPSPAVAVGLPAAEEPRLPRAAGLPPAPVATPPSGPEAAPHPSRLAAPPVPPDMRDDNGRPGAAPAEPTRPIVVPLRADDPPPKPSLTSNERNAFREIARALGARLEGEDEQARAEPKPAAETPAPLAPAGRAPDVNTDPALSDPAPAEAIRAERGPAEAEPAGAIAAETAPETAAQTAAQTAAEAVSADIIRLTPPQKPRDDAFADLIDKLPIGVLVMRGERCVHANRTLLDLLDHDDLRALNAAGVNRLFHDAPPSEGGGVFRLIRRDGGLEPVDARLSAISWHGEPATLLSFRRALDTIDAARLEAATLDAAKAAAQARELTAILDTATDGVITLDERGRILSLNRSAEALFGYDQREVVGENFTLLFAPEAHITALDYLDGLKGGGVASLLNDGREVQGRVRQGGRIPLFMTMGRVGDGEDRKYSAVLRDMTAWKRAEADLVEARRTAEKASEQKSDVLAKISHEIRTPLNAIIGFTEVMSEERFGPVGNERYKGYLQDIQQSGAYLLSLINDLLDLAKIEAGRMDLTFTGVSVNDIATAAVGLLQPEANRQRVVLRTGLAPKLPSVVADERSLRQIVINVLSNAVKFTDPGGQVIVSTAVGDKGEVILRVRDTGIGMNEKELKQALEPFRQVSATRRGQGTGLGLPITKALVEANKGALVISSAKNEGTLVEITFPPQRVLAS
jgi:PAS domain S-box-containing protein